MTFIFIHIYKYLGKYDDNSSRGCILEVDLLSYPKELRELHNYYPLDQYKLDI